MEAAPSPLQAEVAQLQREVTAALQRSPARSPARLSLDGAGAAGLEALGQVPARTGSQRRGGASHASKTGDSPRQRASSKGKAPAAASSVAPDPSVQAFTPREAELLAELHVQRQACSDVRAALKAEKSAAKKARTETAKYKKRAARATEQLDAIRAAFEAEQITSAQLRAQLDALTQQVEAEYGRLEGHQQTVQTLKERMDAMKISTAPLLGVDIAWASESPAAVRVRAVESAMQQQIRHMKQKVAALEGSIARDMEDKTSAKPLANAKVLQHQMRQMELKIAALEMPDTLDYDAKREMESESQPAPQPTSQAGSREGSAPAHARKPDPSHRPAETVSSLRMSPSARAAAKAAQRASDRAVVNKELDRYACRSFLHEVCLGTISS
jgi:hypothetical protein